MLTEHEVLQVEKRRDELRKLYSNLQSVNSQVAALTGSDFDWDEYDFDPEHLSDAIADYLAEVDGSIGLMTEAIEEYDEE